MKISLSLGRLPFLALMLWTPTAFADAVCTLGPSCPGYSPTPLGPLPAVEGVQGVLPAGVFVTAGDVLLTDLSDTPNPCSATAPAFCSDMLRFFDIGNGTAQFYFLYSDDPGTEPSDTGIPTSVQANNFTMDEVGGPLYTAGGASYLIMSDTTPGPDVPEPSTLLLMGSAVTIFLLLYTVGHSRRFYRRYI